MAQTSNLAVGQDFLEGSGQTIAPQQQGGRPRATDPTGLFFLDDGTPTPLYYARQTLARGGSGDPEWDKQLKALDEKTFQPNTPEEKATWKYDSKKGTYYRIDDHGYRVEQSNNPAKEYSDTPIFTAIDMPARGSANFGPTAQSGAIGALAGSKFGPAGAAIGGVAGALSNLPGASGKDFYLAPGDPAQNSDKQRLGTAAEAAQGNANYAATGRSTPAGGWGPANLAPQQIPTSFQAQPVATYTPRAGTNGGSALSAEASRIIEQANQFGAANQTRANDFYSQAAAVGNRAAPQMEMPSSANQQAVYDRAMNFNAQSGAAAIRAERADVSGASRLENMQMDMQGVNNLESWRPTNSQQGVNALYGYNPDATYQSASELNNWQASNTQEGANAVAGFRPDMVQEDAQALRDWQGDRTGIDRLNAYADAPEGPSQAQALLRGQADADKRTQLAMARSGRGGPAAQMAAQRQAMSEGGLIEAETRGQAAALRAAETDAYKSRQLQALAQAGSLISQSEAQRLTALAQAGQLMSQADQQKLQALMAYGELKATQDSQQLSAKQSAGQLNASGDTNRLGAISNAAQLQGQMDSQLLSATGQAAGLRTQQDSIRSNNLQAAGQIRLAGSEINQRGAIAASNADLQAQALNLQSLSLAGNISTEMRSQDISVLRSNLDASLQTLGLNDQQVRFFNQLGSDREVASQNMQMGAQQLGLDASKFQAALDLQWEQFGLSILSQQQQAQYQQSQLGLQQQQLGQQNSQFNQQQALAQQQAAQQAQAQQFAQQQQNRQNNLNLIGSGLSAFSNLFGPIGGGSAASSAAAVAGTGFRPGLTNMDGQPTGTPTGTNSMGMIFDPFTNQWVYPSP